MPRFKEILRLTSWSLMIAAALVIHENPLRTLDVDGFTEPYRTINVSAAEQGIIAELLVKEGDTVHEGQLLATLDDEVLEAAKEIAKAGKESMGRIKSATAAVELKKERYEKLKELQAEGHAHPEEILRAEAEVKIAEAELLSAKEEQNIKTLEYSRIEAQIERRKIISPVDGFVTKIHKEISEFVAATDPIVLTVVQCDRLKVMFPIPAVEASHFSAGKKVKIRFTEDVESAEGLVEVVSQVTDPESDTVRVKVVLDNLEGKYRSGMACMLKIDTPSRQSLTAVTDKKAEK